MPNRSSIFYQNSEQSVFLIDIPASIEIAQIPSSSTHAKDNITDLPAQTQCYRQIFSSKPLEQPYPSPPEPKSEAARARLLSRIPESELLFHKSIASSIQKGVDEIQHGLPRGTKWCGPRRVSSGVTERVEQMAVYEPSRKRLKSDHSVRYTVNTEKQPPLILSPSSINQLAGLIDLHDLQVKNPSPLEAATLRVKGPGIDTTTSYTVPPASSFVLGDISPSQIYSDSNNSPIPRLLSTEKFNIILFDPPWPNRSVRRSSQYPTHGYLEMDSLVTIMQQTIISHLSFGDGSSTKKSMVGIWTTNNAKSRQAAYDAFSNTGLEMFEIWIWIKTTENGDLVSPLDGLWRKPYEVLFLGRPKKDTEEDQELIKRIVAAVPDEHSRKPNLKELLELLFFRGEENEIRDTSFTIKEYTALEVFARNLTAGWCACGNDVLKFNADQWWYQP
ncbi:hypothetical protein EYB26_005805 [Talaromyces marneffei]|uniref:uncharacterized protein n=1 Tax=Talaromyces marneffei TaxID=37727 RepID=UPI0012A8AF14|nr:uncharacterized protein EYB26_005805 [Talaromyces marneffei]QGA18124.1 hypothetical protein EYB26_005805 [Talaromyces marneffei]